MTIAKRLIIQVAVPLLVLVGLGIFVRIQLARIEVSSRFVAEDQVGSLVALANISRCVSDLRMNVRSYLSTDDKGEQDHARKAFEDGKADLTRLPVISFTDITVRKRNQQALAASEDLLA